MEDYFDNNYIIDTMNQIKKTKMKGIFVDIEGRIYVNLDDQEITIATTPEFRDKFKDFLEKFEEESEYSIVLKINEDMELP